MKVRLLLSLALVAILIAANALDSTALSAGAIGGPAATAAPSDTVLLPKPIQKVAPVYPEDAARRGVEATVYFFVHVDEKGYVAKATVDTARTFFSHPGSHHGLGKIEARLVQVAHDAVMKWKFRPGRINGAVAEMDVTVPVQFQLANMQSGILGQPTMTGNPAPDFPTSPGTQIDKGTGKPIKENEPPTKPVVP